jgi:uncharacterized protein involved in outer membrane biogenesis
MSRSLKAIAYASGTLVALLVLGTAALLLFLDVNAYKARLEAAASQMTGMEVSVNGRLGIAFFPGLQVTLHDVQVRNRGTELLAAQKAAIGVDFVALLKQEVPDRQGGADTADHCRSSGSAMAASTSSDRSEARAPCPTSTWPG